MDAASRTGVDDIRDLTEGVRYRPVSARYKVYIIDEVHMLSKNAFNALLKTLEEPPPDVKFVFATTEIHKVPVTVLSRCQRFSLRRVPIELLIAHYRRIAEAEGVEVEPAALALIARAADGSVRDGLSLLDQAIALLGRAGSTEAAVRDMLGIADRGLVFDLFETVLSGDAPARSTQMDRLYQGGADPLMVLQDLLDLSHFVTRLKLAPEAGAGDPIDEGDRERARPLAEKLAMPVLARAWQMLLKGLEEVQTAPSPIQAAEMVLVRLAYVADLPAPAELVRSVEQLTGSAARPRERSRGNGAAITSNQVCRSAAPSAVCAAPPEPLRRGRPLGTRCAGRLAELDAASRRRSPVESTRCRRALPRSSRCSTSRREALLRSHLWSDVHLVAFRAGAHRVPPGGERAARSRQPSRPAAQRMDRHALGRRRLARPKASRPCASRRSAAQRELAERGREPPAGAGGARDLSRRDDRRGARAVCGGRARGRRGILPEDPGEEAESGEDGA